MQVVPSVQSCCAVETFTPPHKHAACHITTGRVALAKVKHRFESPAFNLNANKVYQRHNAILTSDAGVRTILTPLGLAGMCWASSTSTDNFHWTPAA